jgi:pimeloyl-ACP methyl ester carboxylesterase
LHARLASILSVDESGWIQVGADRIFYDEVGEGSATTLIHDGLVHREIWDTQLPVLAERFRVIRYDRRGYGARPARVILA